MYMHDVTTRQKVSYVTINKLPLHIQFAKFVDLSDGYHECVKKGFSEQQNKDKNN